MHTATHSLSVMLMILCMMQDALSVHEGSHLIICVYSSFSISAFTIIIKIQESYL